MTIKVVDQMLLADVIKMNDTKASVNYNNKFSDSNNNNRSSGESGKMGVKYHATSFDRFTEDHEVSMSSKEHREDEEESADVEGLNCDDTSMESAKSVNRSSDPDDIVNNKRQPVVDNNMARDSAADNDDDDEDYGEDNDSVLSVGRDENNFVAGPEEGEEDALKPQRCASSPAPPAPFISKDHQSNNIPCGASPAAASSCDKLGLGLSFRNIHNHLASLKQQQQPPNGGFHSPLQNMFAQNPALWKNSAFEAAAGVAAGPGRANPSALIGFPDWTTNPTAELLHRYDMLRGNLIGRPEGRMMDGPNNHHHHHYPMTHDESLKFSIDNILKADFGRRRITDPINKLRKISNSIMQSAANFNNNLTTKNKLLPTSECSSSRPSSFSALDPMSPTTSNSSSSPVLQQSPPQGPSISPAESPRKLFSPVDLTANANSNNGTGNNKGSERSQSRMSESSSSTGNQASSGGAPMVWPAWVYCTRYSDRPSSGRSPRTKKPKKQPGDKTTAATAAANGSVAASSMSVLGGSPSTGGHSTAATALPVHSLDSSGNNSTSGDDKRPRTAFSGPQLARLKNEFNENRYLTEKRRQALSAELGLHEAQIKIWFQNKRAKIKKTSGQKNPLALQLMAQGLYNHSTIPLTKEEETLQDLHAQQAAAASASSV